MPALPLFRLPGVTEPTKRCPVESRSVLTDNSVGLGVLWVTGYTLLPTTRLALSAPFKTNKLAFCWTNQPVEVERGTLYGGGVCDPVCRHGVCVGAALSGFGLVVNMTTPAALPRHLNKSVRRLSAVAQRPEKSALTADLWVSVLGLART